MRANSPPAILNSVTRAKAGLSCDAPAAFRPEDFI